MFCIPNSIDGFYANLHRIRRELNAILCGEIEWYSNNDASTPLECEYNIMELDNFQAALSPDEYIIEDYDALCTRIEQLQDEFLQLKEDICIASLSNHDWWFNCLSSQTEYLTARLLNNVPLDFIEKNPYTLDANISVEDLIKGYLKAKSTNFEYVLGLACMARNGCDTAREFLWSELSIRIMSESD